MPQTLFDKLWERHRIDTLAEGLDWLYVDRHYIYELNSTQIEILRHAGRKVSAPARTIGVMDHTISSAPGRRNTPKWAQDYMDLLRKETHTAGIPLLDVDTPDQGIAHVSGPELGLTLPGMLVLCGDSHTSTNGAMGALAWGIGASEINTVLATQTIVQRKPKCMRILFEGDLQPLVSAKDLILALIAAHGASSGVGHAAEFGGSTVKAMGMDGRMTLCNMSIEFGAKWGIVAVDDTTIQYASSRPYSLTGSLLEAAIDDWKTLHSDEGASFARDISIDASAVEPQVTWGTSPEHAIAVGARMPELEGRSPASRKAWDDAYAYMGLEPGRPIAGVPIDHVFIGSCTNSRIDDIREAARIAEGNRVAPGVTAWVVPGSGRVRRQAEAEGLDRILRDAGFEWREPGCSMCAGSNGDVLKRGQRSMSTSNRNFVGRQGDGVRTHIGSPATAAASAIAGVIADPRHFIRRSSKAMGTT